MLSNGFGGTHEAVGSHPTYRAFPRKRKEPFGFESPLYLHSRPLDAQNPTAFSAVRFA